MKMTYGAAAVWVGQGGIFVSLACPCIQMQLYCKCFILTMQQTVCVSREELKANQECCTYSKRSQHKKVSTHFVLDWWSIILTLGELQNAFYHWEGLQLLLSTSSKLWHKGFFFITITTHMASEFCIKAYLKNSELMLSSYTGAQWTQKIWTHLFIKLRFLLWISSSASATARACCAFNSSASRRAVFSNLRGIKPDSKNETQRLL